MNFVILTCNMMFPVYILNSVSSPVELSLYDYANYLRITTTKNQNGGCKPVSRASQIAYITYSKLYWTQFNQCCLPCYLKLTFYAFIFQILYRMF